MALLPWLKGTVIRIEDATPDTRRFWIRSADMEVFDFRPGQFVTLDLPIHPKPNKRWRSYSIASDPDGTNVFELVIVLDRKGLGTPYLFNEINVGSELVFRGPQGVFTLKEPLDRDHLLICTGTGVAPFRSMLRYIRAKNIPFTSIHLVFGTRTRSSLLYYEEFIALSGQLENFHYYPTLSRETWEGDTGYVHSIYERICSDRKPASFYLCGWKGMIDEARIRIGNLGYDRKDVHVEIYG